MSADRHLGAANLPCRNDFIRVIRVIRGKSFPLALFPPLKQNKEKEF
jgi:hypothetical protein